MSIPSILNIIPYSKELQQFSHRFCSGNLHLDCFLKSDAALDKNFGTTYVWLSNGNDFIIGFYNIGTGAVEDTGLAPESKIGGSIHINEFALHQDFHGQTQGYQNSGVKINLSDLLLFDCILRAERIRNEIVGFSFITLSSTEEGHSLYARNGFEDLEEDMRFSLNQGEYKCRRMYKAMEPLY